MGCAQYQRDVPSSSQQLQGSSSNDEGGKDKLIINISTARRRPNCWTIIHSTGSKTIGPVGYTLYALLHIDLMSRLVAKSRNCHVHRSKPTIESLSHPTSLMKRTSCNKRRRVPNQKAIDQKEGWGGGVGYKDDKTYYQK
jgi:hypothetical protein